MPALDLAVLAAVLLAGGVLLWPRIARAEGWRATVTPLASIIGSGFLVLGPLLDHAYGAWAPAVMAALCALAWGFGAAIRRNIARIEEGERPAADSHIETLASWALAFAYVISVAYYLNLFGSFAVNLTPFDSPLAARLTTTAAFALILVTGWSRGFAALEGMERYAVTLKLAIIAGLLLGLAVYFTAKAGAGELIVKPVQLGPWPALTLAMGLIVTVQGFETSRYLGQSYTAPRRIASMKRAQLIATAIYMAYILLAAYIFPPGEIETSETAIIDMMRVVAPILPPLLVAAALAAQFSAAVADTGGSGGLVQELTRGRVSQPAAYALLTAAGLALTWGFHVFEIIAFASRAFALYYALQSLLAARASTGSRAALFYTLAATGLAIALLGQSAEAG
ncbi:hypothetical protein [Vannielia litorea]|uniref:hypothetical protein n=1 Tax=Vannielia litorea TaxID=1217970 RepID=UPI001C953596|nr:hypothetical protein [Vannielia litorea]MBY6046411.1 hypothetical protein [Vannielia litorea]MBY6073824.1 hypothetical protein [Vannielia litorea]